MFLSSFVLLNEMPSSVPGPASPPPLLNFAKCYATYALIERVRAFQERGPTGIEAKPELLSYLSHYEAISYADSLPLSQAIEPPPADGSNPPFPLCVHSLASHRHTDTPCTDTWIRAYTDRFIIRTRAHSLCATHSAQSARGVGRPSEHGDGDGRDRHEALRRHQAPPTGKHRHMHIYILHRHIHIHTQHTELHTPLRAPCMHASNVMRAGDTEAGDAAACDGVKRLA